MVTPTEITQARIAQEQALAAYNEVLANFPAPTLARVIELETAARNCPSSDPAFPALKLSAQVARDKYTAQQAAMAGPDAALIAATNALNALNATNNGGQFPPQTTTVTAPSKTTTDFTDWRVRLSLAKGSTYLYNSSTSAGILAPLFYTGGVLFPYTPSIQVTYAAQYSSADLTHSNYKMHLFNNSSVDSIQINCDFTAQDNAEAAYLLAVIHFFKSVTKMFYGQDKTPISGTPPPLCYLTGMGDFQFDQHPLAVTSFNYTLPIDVDYIRAAAISDSAASTAVKSDRLTSNNLSAGGASAQPVFGGNFSAKPNVTYVPTRMQIAFTAVPIISRKDISSRFSLEKYASGKLLQGHNSPNGGGIW